MTIDEQITILNAYKNGKTIQISEIDAEEWVDINDEDHEFNFSGYDYRIKPEEPEPKYRPYKNAEEVEDAIREHGIWLKDNNDEKHFHTIISAYNDDYVWCGSADSGMEYEKISEYYTWQDGTPFGKLEEK